MPVSIATARDPFRGRAPQPADAPLRLPQARVLRALLPPYPEDPPLEWPLLGRAALGVRAGYTPLSGSVTRALNGIYPGSSSGDPHLGLLARAYVVEVPVDVCGITEVMYRATADGVRGYQAFVAAGGKLPPVKDAALCTNGRYMKG